MVQGISFAAITLLQDASTSVEEKLHVAKALKNIIVGQDQRKVLAVKSDIIQPLVTVISAQYPSRDAGKAPRNTDGDRPRPILPDDHPDSPEDELRQQAVLIIGTLAAGGYPFLRPLCAADAPGVLVDALSSGVSSRLVTAILKALKELAMVWEPTDVPEDDHRFWSSIINPRSLEVFDFILREQRSSQGIQQLRLVPEILGTVPITASFQKNLITDSGVLDTLTNLLVSNTVATAVTLFLGDAASLLKPPPLTAVPSLLAAISTTINGSIYRAHRFVLSPSVRELFGSLPYDSDGAGDSRVPFGPRHGFDNRLDKSLLPPIQVPFHGSINHRYVESINFPASKLLQPTRNGSAVTDLSYMRGDIDHVNAVCGWLLVLARSWTGVDRLAALRLLALVTSTVEGDAVGQGRSNDFIKKTRERERQMALLAVPLAVRLVHTAGEIRGADGTQEQQDHKGIKEQACIVLSLMIRGNKDLQLAAYHADAIKHISVILRKSFDTIQPAKPMWTIKNEPSQTTRVPETCRLGSSSIPAEIKHAMECRRGALEALEAITATDDEPRKAVSHQGVIGNIIDSLKPFAPHAFSAGVQNGLTISAKDGNTVPVIIAACQAVQSLSRSVSILRTSLIDGSIAKPLTELLLHPSLDVKIAATDVCCNLLAEFSPMREEITEASASILTEHARGTSTALQYSSLWALKHLLVKCSNDFKISTIKKLGVDWLINAIRGEHPSSLTTASSTSGIAGLSTSNAAGQQVDLLNPSIMEIDNPTDRNRTSRTNDAASDDDDEDKDNNDEDGEVLFDAASSTHYQASQLRSTLKSQTTPFSTRNYLNSIQAIEQSEEFAARRSDTRIQQQSLDVLRNFLNGTDSAPLNDFILQHVGATKLFDLLAAKLAPLPRSLTDSTTVYHPSEIILSTIHVVNHLSIASTSRIAMMNHRSLLTALLPHFTHAHASVRTMCVWTATSLTWVEDESDRFPARARVQELKGLGMEQAVRQLQNDPHHDVRERVKTALRQFEI